MRRTLTIAGAALLLPIHVMAQQALPPVVQPDAAVSESVEGRIDRLERLLESRALIEIVTRLDELQAEVQQLRGELELQGRDLDVLKQRQRELYLDIDRRLRRLELGSPAAAAAPAATPAAEPAVATPPAPAAEPAPPTAEPVAAAPAAPQPPAADPLQEQSAYQAAFELLKEGRYPESIQSFSAFIATYAGGSYADNAQYWLGEANYVTREFATSVVEFEKVLSAYPDSPKVPDAMLKLGYAHYEMQAWGKARAILTELREKYPSSTAARLAASRLKRMADEGR